MSKTVLKNGPRNMEAKQKMIDYGTNALTGQMPLFTLSYMVRHAIKAGATMDETSLFTADQIKVLMKTHFVDPGPENTDPTGWLNEDGVNWNNVNNVLFSW